MGKGSYDFRPPELEDSSILYLVEKMKRGYNEKKQHTSAFFLLKGRQAES